VIPLALKKSSFVFVVLFLGGCAFFAQTPEEKLNLEKLTPEHIAKVKTLVAKLAPFIEKKDRKGELPSLNFRKLESSLNAVSFAYSATSSLRRPALRSHSAGSRREKKIWCG
jgi:hypothetical protein